MDTIKKGRYEDTNKLFEIPKKVDFHIKEWSDENQNIIYNAIKDML